MTRNVLQSFDETEESSQVRSRLEASFDRALATLWVAFQPIVRASDRSVFGYEALLRTDEPSLPGPGSVLEAAEQLRALDRLGRAVRGLAAEPLLEDEEGPVLFLNLHPRDLADPELLDPASLPYQIAHRVVLEITEHAPLGEIEQLGQKLACLRAAGYRIAVDDLGAGYAGLTSFALLEPEIVKLDMALVRDIDASSVKQKVVASMVSLARDLGVMIIAEGVETVAERDTLLGLGCDLFQGHLFGRADRGFSEPLWDELPACELPAELPDSGTHRVADKKVELAPNELAAALFSRAGTAGHVVPLEVLDGLGEGVLLVNAEGRIVYSNAAYARIFGAAAPDCAPGDWAEHCGMYLPDGTTPFPPAEYPVLRALAGEATDNVEVLVRSDQVPHGVLIAATARPLFDVERRVCGASILVRDISALRRAEEHVIRANAELRAAQQRQSELSAFLVHDLKSPLSAILTSVGSLASGVTVDEQRECVRDIRESALSMRRMVLDILDVHTAEDGALVADLFPVDVAALLEEVRAAMAPRAAQRSQRVHVVSSALPRMMLNADLLRRVLQNLVDNSIKYSPTASNIWLDAQLNADALLLRVRDEGVGVPPALRTRIFEKYVQLERDVRGRHRDSRGLGLRFCQLAVEAHGGKVWVGDNTPKGACFFVELPRLPRTST